MPYDPVTGDWYDDEEDFSSFLYGGATNPYLGGFDGGALLPSDYNKYGEMEPYEMADVNQQFTGINNLFKLLANPGFNMYTSLMDPGSMAYDYSQLIPGAATGGAAGGGGGAGSYQSVYTTPWSDAAAQSADPVEKGIYDAIAAGQTPSSVINGLRESLTPEELETYANTASNIFNERAGFERNALQPVPPAPLTAQQEFLAKAGIPDPTRMYDENFLPPDVDLSGMPAADRLDPMIEQARAQSKALRKEAIADSPGWQLPFQELRDRQPQGLNRFLGGGDSVAPAVSASQEGSYVNPRTGQAYPGADTTVTGAINRNTGQRAGDIEVTPDRRGLVPNTGSREPAPRNWFREALARAAQPAPQPQQRNMLPFALAGQRGGASNQRVNIKARQATNANQRANMLEQKQADDERGYRQLVAKDLQNKGRSPAKDTLQRKLAMIRAMGIGI